jgi:hypothetical protein
MPAENVDEAVDCGAFTTLIRLRRNRTITMMDKSSRQLILAPNSDPADSVNGIRVIACARRPVQCGFSK